MVLEVIVPMMVDGSWATILLVEVVLFPLLEEAIGDRTSDLVLIELQLAVQVLVMAP